MWNTYTHPPFYIDISHMYAHTHKEKKKECMCVCVYIYIYMPVFTYLTNLWLPEYCF